MFYCIPYIGHSQWYLFPRNKTYVGITYHIWKEGGGEGRQDLIQIKGPCVPVIFFAYPLVATVRYTATVVHYCNDRMLSAYPPVAMLEGYSMGSYEAVLR